MMPLLQLHRRLLPWLALTFLLSAPLLQAGDVKISAALDPTQINQGQDTMLRISIAGASRANITLPNVEGLQFFKAGQSTSIQFVNLQRMDTVTYLFRITGFKPGAYTIPPIIIVAEGQTLQTQPLNLNILKSSAPGFNPPPGSTPDPNNPTDESEISVDPEQSGQPVFLQLDLKTDTLYVGQIIPVAYRLFVRSGYPVSSLKSLPTLQSDALTQELPEIKPLPYQASINGVPYKIFAWNGSLTAFKSGTYQLSATQQIEVVDQERTLGGASSLLDQLIGRAVARPLELTTKSHTLNILPLPTEGRPASFSGAIGTFTFVTRVAPTELSVGDPLELNATIEGKGNFNRIEWPGQPSNRSWRGYPPSARFQALGDNGLEGKKIYTQAVIPLSADVKEFPSLEFSYFDPEKAQYKTLRSDPVTLSIVNSTSSLSGERNEPSSSSVPTP
ncbi:MAG: protein BatD, partial [Blastochloris sp.]|nr:protein BatD [Blastochloris sp.]